MSPAARSAMVKLAHQHAEHARVAVRKVRHKAMADIKAVSKQIGEDEKKKREKRIDEVTKKFIVQVDGALANKENELKL
jgi:ribosome recycling factor